MGGRGASSGISENGKLYGTEYTSLMQSGNIKYVRYLGSTSAKTPMETMTKGRVYATVNEKDEVTSISYYSKSNLRFKQIDLMHYHKGMKPHVHLGYEHSELGYRGPNAQEKRMIARVLRVWHNKK